MCFSEELKKSSIENSFSIYLLKRYFQGLLKLIKMFKIIYEDSYSYKFRNSFQEKLILILEGSLFGRITQIREKNLKFVISCKTVQCLANLYSDFKERTSFYFGLSFAKKFLRFFRSEYFSGADSLNIIIATAIFSNILMSVILRTNIDIFGWFFRIILFSIFICHILFKNSIRNAFLESSFLKCIKKLKS